MISLMCGMLSKLPLLRPEKRKKSVESDWTNAHRYHNIIATRRYRGGR